MDLSNLAVVVFFFGKQDFVEDSLITFSLMNKLSILLVSSELSSKPIIT